MIKYYCDVCGKEEQRLCEVRIPHTKGDHGNFGVMPIEVCQGCEKRYDALIDLLLDIRFELFEKFYTPIEKRQEDEEWQEKNL